GMGCMCSIATMGFSTPKVSLSQVMAALASCGDGAGRAGGSVGGAGVVRRVPRLVDGDDLGAARMELAHHRVVDGGVGDEDVDLAAGADLAQADPAELGVVR